MKHDQLTGLKDRRAELARAVDAIKAQPDHDEDELQDLERMIAAVDQLVRKAERAAKPAPAAISDGTQLVHVGRVRKNDFAEVRVSVDVFKGRHVLDVRLWHQPPGKEEMVRSRMGVTMHAHKIDALIDALVLAKQYLPSRGKAGS